MNIDIVLTATDHLPNGYLYAEVVDTDGFLGRKIVRQSDGAICLGVIFPMRTVPTVVGKDRLDVVISARAERAFKDRMAVAAIRAPDAIQQLASKYGLYVAQILKWRNELLERFDPEGEVQE
ncbi:hypothetical protein [Pendulispora albinea]|uniref:Uncharacterized protein n=1 Tax=Pendulispora albinea TaxID=2741071 RepID=A0ABZ2LKU4_9BACT